MDFNRIPGLHVRVDAGVAERRRGCGAVVSCIVFGLSDSQVIYFPDLAALSDVWDISTPSGVALLVLAQADGAGRLHKHVLCAASGFSDRVGAGLQGDSFGV